MNLKIKSLIIKKKSKKNPFLGTLNEKGNFR
jgi:hypothetical protein